jgi:hypothetical protein
MRRYASSVARRSVVSGAMRTVTDQVSQTRHPKPFERFKIEIPLTLVPEGSTASRFQSHNRPSTRRDNIRKLALVEQSTERLAAVTIGLTYRPYNEFLRIRDQLPAVIADALGIDAEHVSLSLTRRATRRGRNAWDEPRLPNVTAVDPVPHFFFRVHLDEGTYDIDDMALYGNELFLTVLEGSHKGLRGLSVCYAEPPSAEFESLPDEMAGEPITADDLERTENYWEKKRAEAHGLRWDGEESSADDSRIPA